MCRLSRSGKRKQRKLDRLTLPDGVKAEAVPVDEWGRTTAKVQEILRGLAKNAVQAGTQRPVMGATPSALNADIQDLCESQLVRRWREYLSQALARSVAAGIDLRARWQRDKAAELEYQAGEDYPVFGIEF